MSVDDLHVGKSVTAKRRGTEAAECRRNMSTCSLQQAFSNSLWFVSVKHLIEGRRCLIVHGKVTAKMCCGDAASRPAVPAVKQKGDFIQFTFLPDLDGS